MIKNGLSLLLLLTHFKNSNRPTSIKTMYSSPFTLWCFKIHQGMLRICENDPRGKGENSIGQDISSQMKECEIEG